MIKKKLLFVFLLTSTNVFGATVATVNGSKISSKTFQREYAKARLLVTNQVVTKEKVLDDLINREVGIQRAKKIKLQNDAEVKYKMEDVLFHAQVSKDLEPRYRAIRVNDSEVKSYYKKFPEYRTAHILFRLRAKTGKKEFEVAMKEAFKVSDLIKLDSSKFAELANKYSQASNNLRGGDMGYRPAVAYAPEYFQAIKQQKIDYVSSPIRTQFGIHIIKLLGVKKFKEIDAGLYKKIIFEEKKKKVTKKYFDELKAKVNIKINKQSL